MAKLSATKQWELDHPDDTPCPSGSTAAAAWRRRRGLDAASNAIREKYEAAMAEKRAWQAKQEATAEICPRCGAAEQATHHPLCQERDGTPTSLSDEEVRAALIAHLS
jgi:hypothetical protein